MKFTVYGRPQTAGSKRSFAVKREGRFTGATATTDDNPRTKSWQAAVRDAAIDTGGAECLSGPVYVELTFYLNRPQAHYRTGRYADLLRDAAPRRHAKRPDVLKLARAIEDALTGVLWKDDAQICDERLRKRYAGLGEPERVLVWVSAIDPTEREPRQPPPPLAGQLELATTPNEGGDSP